MKYKIKEIMLTIQGEGVYVGYPAIFIRFSGCPLRCKWEGGVCDTDFEGGEELELNEILKRVSDVTPVYESYGFLKEPIIVITGGEPLVNDLSFLIEGLADYYNIIQIETSGVSCHENNLAAIDDYSVDVICSPKTSKIDKKLIPYIRAYKYILEEGNISEDGLPSRNPINGKELFRCPVGSDIYINPVDSGDVDRNRKNLGVCIKSSLENGYILGIQLHKYLGVR